MSANPLSEAKVARIGHIATARVVGVRGWLSERDDREISMPRPTERDPRVYRASVAFRSARFEIDQEAAFEQRRKFYTGEKSAK